jgi:hypothetical protein
MTKQKLPKEIEELLVWQKLNKAPTEEGLRQLSLGIGVFVTNCRTCQVEVNDNFVQINLMRFQGLKGLYNKLFKKDKLTEQQTEIVTKLVKFWLSFLDSPMISIAFK